MMSLFFSFFYVLLDILFVDDAQFGSWMHEKNQTYLRGGTNKQLFLSVGTNESNFLKLQSSLVVLQEVDCFSGILF